MPRSRANIDHLAVTQSGVYMVDTKRYHGTVEVRRPLFGVTQLRIAGSDRTKLIEGLARQVDAARALVGEVAPDVPVHGCLCFVAPEGFLTDGGVPLLRTLAIGSYQLFYPRRLAKRLNAPGPLAAERIDQLLKHLAQRLPAA